MRLRWIRLSNYKGFKDSGEITLGSDWTVVVGRNNAGKSALLEAFSVGSFSNKPHRSISQDTLLPLAPNSRLDLGLSIASQELEHAFLHGGGHEMWVPVPQADSQAFLERMFFSAEIELSLYKIGQQNWGSNHRPSHGLFRPNPEFAISSKLVPQRSRQAWALGGGAQSTEDSIPQIAGYWLQINSYVFRAERKVNASCPIQSDLTLQPDAANLAGALHYLFNYNQMQFQRYLALVREVLPEVEAITIPPINGGQVEIRVWNNGYHQERPDLAIPLQECGTGIGQVLAILFVVATATSSRILVIDEPNSFLHPGASRVLMQLLRKFKQHQFIVTTHSPEIISAIEPESMVVIRWEKDESSVTTHGGASIIGVRAAFDELGVRLSDVYGYDAIAWVEGKTEERCFPELLKAAGTSLPSRTAFVAVVNTGDFESADAEVIWGVYRQLAIQSAFAPPAISISLDSEIRSSKLKDELIGKSDGLVRFLPRRTYENYLLHAAAITAVIKSEAGGESSVSAEAVSNWIEAHQHDPRYFTRGAKLDIDDSDVWRCTIDAPRFLGDLISEITQYTQDYRSRKVQYGVALTSWLIENDRVFLDDIIEYVKSLLVPVPPTG